MKTIKRLIYFFSAAALLTLTACDEEKAKYEPAPIPSGTEAFFSATNRSSITLEENASSFTVELSRGKSAEAADVAIESQAATGISVPATLSFAAGAEKANLTVTVDQSVLTPGETYPVELTVEQSNATPYGSNTLTVRVKTWLPEPPISWEPVETVSVFVDNIINLRWKLSTPPYEVKVQRSSDGKKYRIENPWSPNVNPTIADYSSFFIAQEPYYLEIDVSDPDKVYIPIQTTGLNINQLGEVECGSVYNNFNVDMSKYVYGTFDEKNGIINFGSMALGTPDTGPGEFTAPTGKDPAILYLDKSKMGVDFSSGFTFQKFASGSFVSEQNGIKWEQSLFQGAKDGEQENAEFVAEYGVPYMLPDLYAEDFPLYFCVKDGTISVPSDYLLQDTGQKLGTEAIMAKINGKKSKMEEDGTLTLTIEFQTESGTFKSPARIEAFKPLTIEPGQSIDDFIGDFALYADEYLEDDNGPMPPVEGAPVTITKVSDTEATISGLFYDHDWGVNDVAKVTFNAEDGYCYLAGGQVVGTLVYQSNNYEVNMTTFSPSGKYLFSDPRVTLRIGVAGEGKLAMVDNPSNSELVDDDGNPVYVNGVYFRVTLGALAAPYDMILQSPAPAGALAPYNGTKVLTIDVKQASKVTFRGKGEFNTSNFKEVKKTGRLVKNSEPITPVKL